jgi:hypothetical protein
LTATANRQPKIKHAMPPDPTATNADAILAPHATRQLAPAAHSTAPENSAVALIREAIAAKADPAQLRELLAVRREWEADEARKLFNRALAQFQRRAPMVPKADRAHNKQYATMGRIWQTVAPLLTELGMTVTWQVFEVRDSGMCHVEGQLRHEAGHGERLAADLPMPDLVPGQNRAQQIGSARTYVQRYAFCAATGVQTGEELDDDCAGAGGALVTAEQVDALRERFDAARGLQDFNEGAFWKFVGGTDLGALPAHRYADVLTMLDRKLKGGAK